MIIEQLLIYKLLEFLASQTSDKEVTDNALKTIPISSWKVFQSKDKVKIITNQPWETEKTVCPLWESLTEEIALEKKNN